MFSMKAEESIYCWVYLIGWPGMAFWGIKVKPQNPYTHLSKTSKGRLHVSQATLGIGSATNKTMVQCNVGGDKYPVFLCALLPGISESCSLDLEFDELQDVIFSVIGPRTVHLTGYYLPSRPQFGGDDESESYGEDIERSENEESTHCSDDYNDYDDSFINDDDMSYYSDDNEEDEDSVINKPVKKKDRKRLKKKHQPDEPVGIVVHVPQQTKHYVHRRSRALTVPSDDEDNMEASNDNGSLPRDQRNNIKCGDLKPASSDEADYKDGPETKKLKTDQHKVEVKKGNVHTKIEKADNESNPHSELQLQSNKEKKKRPETGKDIDGGESKEAPPDEITGRILSGGLIIEQLAEGKAEGKVACRGKKVKIKFVGKLQSGKVIESNTYETLHKFRLGAGNVIEGLNIGIEGMRIGGKRRITIPPSLGYGSEGIEEKIPPDSWLIYEIELISTP